MPLRRAFSVTFLAAILAAGLLAQNPGDCLVQDAAFQSANGGCQDQVTSIAFSSIHLQQTWDGAGQVCSTLVEGGFDDWRLPTVAELQAAAAHGASTHLDFGPFSTNGYRYSDRSQGQWCTAVRMTDGHAKKLLKSSWIGFFCVRSGGSAFAATQPAAGTSTASMSASHVFDRGQWHVHLRAPQHAGQPYLILAGTRAPNLVPGIENVVLLGAGSASPFFQPGPGALDVEGRATIGVDLIGLGVPATAYSSLAMALVVLDSAQPQWAVYPLSAAVQR